MTNALGSLTKSSHTSSTNVRMKKVLFSLPNSVDRQCSKGRGRNAPPGPALIVLGRSHSVANEHLRNLWARGQSRLLNASAHKHSCSGCDVVHEESA